MYNDSNCLLKNNFELPNLQRRKILQQMYEIIRSDFHYTKFSKIVEKNNSSEYGNIFMNTWMNKFLTLTLNIPLKYFYWIKNIWFCSTLYFTVGSELQFKQISSQNAIYPCIFLKGKKELFNTQTNPSQVKNRQKN